MQISKYLSTFHGLKMEGYFNRMVTTLLLLLVLFLVAVLATRPTIVTIQPWTLAEDAQVTRDDASRSYLEAWGFALAELVGNVTPGNVAFVSLKAHSRPEGLSPDFGRFGKQRPHPC